jgi:flagellar hook assembly protein FlgD
MQISQVLNYPNPFSTSTQFIFTLTGEKVPDKIKIQILNIRGQVVREIQKEELGPLKIGLNRTTYAWNGTDQYGDRLANGVYLYKVVVMDNNKPVDMLNSSDFKDINNSKTDISKYFEHNYGKMVILR